MKLKSGISHFYNHWIHKTLGKQNLKVEKSTVKHWKSIEVDILLIVTLMRS